MTRPSKLVPGRFYVGNPRRGFVFGLRGPMKEQFMFSSNPHEEAIPANQLLMFVESVEQLEKDRFSHREQIVKYHKFLRGERVVFLTRKELAKLKPLHRKKNGVKGAK